MRRLSPSAALRVAPPFLVVGVIALLGGCASTSPPSGSAGGSHARVWRPGSPDSSGPILAVVGTRRIKKHDVDSILAMAPPELQEQYKDPAQYRELLDRMVEQEVAYQAAKDSGTERDSSYQAEVAAQTRQILLNRYYQNALNSVAGASDSLVRSYYEEHAADYRVPARARVRHILLPTQTRAKEVRRKLKAGALWDQACARYSTDKVSGQNGGIIGYVTADTDVVPGVGKAPAIVAAAFALKEGETSQPLKSERGWHLIRSDNVSEASVQPLGHVERQIRGTLDSERRRAFGVALVDSLKRRYGATVFEDSIQAALNPTKSPADLFADAQATSDPNERINLFRSVVLRYPQDKSAIQAAFMIGFTYAEELQDYPAARTAFEEFTKNYPGSDLVPSAKWMMENMGSPDPSLGGDLPADSLDAAPGPVPRSEAAPGSPEGSKTKP